MYLRTRFAACSPRRIRATSISDRTPARKPSSRPERIPMRELLERSFRAAVAAADPLHIVAPHLPSPPKGRTYVAAAGKAAAAMAAAVEAHWKGSLEGLAITRYGHGVPTKRIRVVEAGHPV